MQKDVDGLAKPVERRCRLILRWDPATSCGSPAGAPAGVVRLGADGFASSACATAAVPTAQMIVKASQTLLAIRSQPGQIVWGSDQAPLIQLGDALPLHPNTNSTTGMAL